MQPGTGQPGDARQVGDLQRVGGMLFDMRIEGCVGQALAGVRLPPPAG
jgi:hypothetical protein